MPIKLTGENKSVELNWLCIKLSFAWFWFRQMAAMLHFGGSCPYPAGVCKIYSFNFLFTGAGVWLLAAILLLCLILYLYEKQMLLVTGVLTLFTCIIISHHESSGIMLRATPFTTVFGAQFFAYLLLAIRPGFNLPLYRQQYAVQIIAATYTLAAISKFMASGTGWAETGSNLFALQVVKSFSFLYFDTGDISVLQKGYAIADFMLQHKVFLKFLLATSLLLETCCFAVVLFPRLRTGYGIALMLMHAGIYYCMNILISGLVFPMVIFFINPLYLLIVAGKRGAALFRKN